MKAFEPCAAAVLTSPTLCNRVFYFFRPEKAFRNEVRLGYDLNGLFRRPCFAAQTATSSSLHCQALTLALMHASNVCGELGLFDYIFEIRRVLLAMGLYLHFVQDVLRPCHVMFVSPAPQQTKGRMI